MEPVQLQPVEHQLLEDTLEESYLNLQHSPLLQNLGNAEKKRNKNKQSLRVRQSRIIK